jgi:hypothetical protein
MIGWRNLNINSVNPSMLAQIHNPAKVCKLCQHCNCQLVFSDNLGSGTCAKIGMPFVPHKSLARDKDPIYCDKNKTSIDFTRLGKNMQ